MQINTKVSRIGEVKINNFGSKMTIIDYKDNKKLLQL